MELDKWQKEVLETKGHICLCKGRQVGGSTVISRKAGNYAMENPNKTIMIIAAVERQAFLLFEKVLDYVYKTNKKLIKKGKANQTKSKLNLTNGSTIHCLPTGETGYGIRGFTIHQLYADEAAHINEDVWMALTPSLSTTGGDIILISTPKGRVDKEGKANYFYRCSKAENFTQFRISSEDSEHIDKKFLEEEKEWMSSRQYSQEYLGQFVDGLGQFFSPELVNEVTTEKEVEIISKYKDYYLGVDIARMGEDFSTFEIIDGTNKELLIHVKSEVTKKTLTTATTRKIISLNREYNFKQIFIDDGGMGVGVLDQLLEETTTRRKVIAIMNQQRPLEHKSERPKQKKITVEAIYNNLLAMMENRKIKLLNDGEVRDSLNSVQFEYVGDNLKFNGRNKHIADGLARAAWSAKDKHLKLWVASSNNG